MADNQEQLNHEQLIRDFKCTFGTVEGKRVFEHLKIWCRATPQLSCFDSVSDRQTSYNLGANAVFRYIQNKIESKLDKKESDCQIEPQTERE